LETPELLAFDQFDFAFERTDRADIATHVNQYDSQQDDDDDDSRAVLF
jgi:hypothetical protein